MAVNPVPISQDITRVTLSVLAVLGLLAASVYILRPFVPALVWGTTIAVATWPVLLRVQSRLGGRRGPAVAFMSLLMVLLVAIPLYAAIAAVLSRTDGVAELVRSLSEGGLPPPPSWVADIPLVGTPLAERWQGLSASGVAREGGELAPYVAWIVRFLTAQARSLGGTLIHLLITLIVVGVLYATGDRAATAVRRFFRRLAGRRGDDAVVLAGKSIRAVALGVMLTALVQTVLTGAGLLIAGVPRAGLLTALALFLCVAQVGPALVLIPAIIWLFASDHTAAGAVLLVWSVAPLTVDNFLRPYLIKRGADLPLWLIFLGVIGGLLAFGVIGLFIGPVILAVTYTLVREWVGDLGPDAAAAPTSSGDGAPGLSVAP
jgi:predicted PurR-regulated permease PerM